VSWLAGKRQARYPLFPRQIFVCSALAPLMHVMLISLPGAPRLLTHHLGDLWTLAEEIRPLQQLERFSVGYMAPLNAKRQLPKEKLRLMPHSCPATALSTQGEAPAWTPVLLEIPDPVANSPNQGRGPHLLGTGGECSGPSLGESFVEPPGPPRPGPRFLR
jgi:hypothetical protein